MRKQLLGVVAVLGLLVGFGVDAASAGGRPLTADLSSENEVPAVPTGATGAAQVTLNQGQGEVCVDIQIEGLEGTVRAGHIHVGEAGMNGGVVVNLMVDSADFSTCIGGVSKDVIKAIRQNPAGYYINIHTTAFPGGEVRGQLSK